MFFAMSVSLIAYAAGTQGAFAQSCAAKTCSEAYRACSGKHCQRERTGTGGDCARFCSGEYQRCLQTGEFRGRVCQKTGLIRK
jgi:hypothetical protein